jgi:hypothetical protein
VRVELSGGEGGHSGGGHRRGRLNALKGSDAILARPHGGAVRLVSFEGGVSRNAIPR